jgi:hypothetical protein
VDYSHLNGPREGEPDEHHPPGPDCIDCGQECLPTDPNWLYQDRDTTQPIHLNCERTRRANLNTKES